MEINKNKLIFGVIGVILLIIFIFLLLNLNSDTKRKTIKKSERDFDIWIVGDKSQKFTSIIDDFKKNNPKYRDYNIKVSSFSSYDDYTYVLATAIISGKSPDVFVLNNNEKNSMFLNQVLGVNPDIVNPNDFRKKHKNFFSNDLIQKQDGKDFLVGIPVGYETLGIFYNSKYVKASSLTTFSGLNMTISRLKKMFSDSSPLGIGNGTTVKFSSDIATQFLMLSSGVNSISNISDKEIKSGLGSYLDYGYETGENNYNYRYKDLKSNGDNATKLFTSGDTFMLIGYPRLINEIRIGRGNLLATSFPKYPQGKQLVNYNYFVLSKDTPNLDLANIFLAYLNSPEGNTAFVKSYPYYIPALSSFETELSNMKINPNYNVVLEDFFNTNYDEFSSFDKGIKNLYDSGLENILDNSGTYIETFKKFIKNLSCKSKKISNLDVSTDCGE